MGISLIVAVVQKIVANGEHGPFAVATIDGFTGGSVTFSLYMPVWPEEARPEEGEHVVLDDVRKKRSGWRANRARFYRLTDEQAQQQEERSKEMDMREVLRRAGFVHVSCLPVFRGGQKLYNVGEKGVMTGQWGENNGKVVAIIDRGESGEIWLAAASEAARQLAKKICQKGQGAYVPASNGEHFSEIDLLRRLADPDCGSFFG